MDRARRIHEAGAVVVRASMVVRLTHALRRRGIEWCVVGGWGVDALVGQQTREHTDLDVFVRRDELDDVLETLRQAGFRHASAWGESRPLASPGPCAGHDSAFVMTDDDGAEVDVHVYESRGARVEPLWDTPIGFEHDDVAARGVVAGIIVRCLTAEKQLEAHNGYELPEPHRHDVDLLRRLLAEPE